MEINNNTNISSQVISSLSKLNLINNQVQAQNETPKSEDILLEDTLSAKEEDTKLIEKAPSNKIDVEEIKKYAQALGETITNEDINYGLTYGRSVIADYCV